MHIGRAHEIISGVWIVVCSCGWESKAYPRQYDGYGPLREHATAANIVVPQEPT
jgi:hypothetical protein